MLLQEDIEREWTGERNGEMKSEIWRERVREIERNRGRWRESKTANVGKRKV